MIFFIFYDFIFNINCCKFYANSVDHDQMPRFAASDLALHYLPVYFYGTLSKNGK